MYYNSRIHSTALRVRLQQHSNDYCPQVEG